MKPIVPRLVDDGVPLPTDRRDVDVLRLGIEKDRCIRALTSRQMTAQPFQGLTQLDVACLPSAVEISHPTRRFEDLVENRVDADETVIRLGLQERLK